MVDGTSSEGLTHTASCDTKARLIASVHACWVYARLGSHAYGMEALVKDGGTERAFGSGYASDPSACD